MRRTTRIATMVATAAMASTVLAAAPPAGEVGQTITGSISLPQPTKASGTNVSRINRTAGLIGSATNGVVSWYFAVPDFVNGGAFELTTSAAGADLDIIFYADPGTITDAPTATAEFVGTTGTGEAGIIPPGSRYAVIYAAAGTDVPFSYTAHAKPELRLSGSLDLTVATGETVVFVNDTAGALGLTGDVSTGGAGRDLPIDGTLEKTFGTAGTFTYATSDGRTGTITVE
ncbi:MAG: hypothetical protein ACLGIR_04625 [Actinomycetes bacterium]